MFKAMLIVALLVLALSPGAYGQNADSYEPNNEIGDATDLGLNQPISSSIFPAQEADFYRIRLDSPGVLQAQLSSVPPEMKGRIDLYAKNMNWINRKDAENPGDSVNLRVDIGNPGWYYLGIVDLDGGSHSSDYSLAVYFEPIVDKEPNGEIGYAIELPPEEGVAAYIFPAQDVDYYKTFLNSSGILEASLADVPQSVSGSMKGRIDLYAQNMNWINRMDAANAADDVILKADIGSPGWYYFGVSDLNGGSYNQTYDFHLDFEPVIDQEPNNEIGDAIEIQRGNMIMGYIFPAGDVDFYKIYVDNAGQLQAATDSVPKSAQASMRGRIDLYGKNMNWMDRRDAENSGDGILLKVDIASPGWYYLGVSDLNGGSYDKEYSLIVS